MQAKSKQKSQQKQILWSYIPVDLWLAVPNSPNQPPCLHPALARWGRVEAPGDVDEADGVDVTELEAPVQKRYTLMKKILRILTRSYVDFWFSHSNFWFSYAFLRHDFFHFQAFWKGKVMLRNHWTITMNGLYKKELQAVGQKAVQTILLLSAVRTTCPTKSLVASPGSWKEEIIHLWGPFGGAINIFFSMLYVIMAFLCDVCLTTAIRFPLGTPQWTQLAGGLSPPSETSSVNLFGTCKCLLASKYWITDSILACSQSSDWAIAARIVGAEAGPASCRGKHSQENVLR